MKSMRVVALSLLMVLIVACQSRETAPAPQDDAITLMASNYPVYYLADRLAPDGLKVEYPVPANIDPAFWEPTPDDIQALQSADLILLNGASYEKWREWVSLPESRVVETANSFRDEWIIAMDATAHSHGPGAEHTHGEVDFNTWLNPRHATRQAEAIAEAMQRLVPDEAATIAQNLHRLSAELEHLDKLLASTAAAIGDAPIIASHPVYDYLAQRYELNLRSVHWEPDLAPSPMGWTEFEQLLDAHPAKVMLWELAPLEETAAQLRERGITPIVFETAGNTPESGDYLQIMQANAERLKNEF
jgi:zinc transport system substrate-binding protein